MLPETSTYIWVDVAPVVRTSYVDLRHLGQCLDMYFAGILDEIDLDRLWMPLDRLVPGNPLAGHLDSDTMRRILFALPEAQRTAIALHYHDCPELGQQLAHSYVQATACTLSFAEYQQQEYFNGVLALAEKVHELI